MHTADPTRSILKPLLWIAGGFFATGFLACLAFGLNGSPG